MYKNVKGKGAGKYNGMDKARDWEGKRICAIRQIRNKGGQGVMPGARGTVTSAYQGLNITFDICAHCGTVAHFSRVDYSDVELVKENEQMSYP